MKHIIGARIGTVIHTDPRVIADAVQSGAITEWIDRRRMQFMAACDLGPRWDRLAKSKTLFIIADDGSLQPP